MGSKSRHRDWKPARPRSAKSSRISREVGRSSRSIRRISWSSNAPLTHGSRNPSRQRPPAGGPRRAGEGDGRASASNRTGQGVVRGGTDRKEPSAPLSRNRGRGKRTVPGREGGSDPGAGGGQRASTDRLGHARGDLGNRDRKNGKGPEGTRGADRRIGNPGAGSRRQGGPVPGDGGHTRGRAPNLADDYRIPTGAAQGAAGNVRTRERLAAGSLGGPRDAP